MSPRPRRCSTSRTGWPRLSAGFPTPSTRRSAAESRHRRMIIRALVPVVFVLGIAAAAGPSPATPWPPATVSPRAADTLVELRRDDTQAAVKRLRAAGATLVGP